MTRLENFWIKGFFAHAIVSLVKLDKGCSFTPLWTYFYAIGNVLFRYWGFTLSLLGIHSSCSPVFLSSTPHDSFVFPQCLSVQTLTVCMS